MKKLVISIIALCSSIVGADTMVTVMAKGFMNGCLNVYFKRSNCMNATVEAQMRDTGAGDDAWTTLSSGTVVSSLQSIQTGDGNVNWALYRFPTNFIGQADIRLRLTEGQTVGEWTTIEGLRAYWHARGIKSIGNTTAISTVLDGNFRSMIDSDEGGSTPWFGFAYAPGTLVERVRIMPRTDSSNADRLKGAHIDIASDETFTDAQTVYTMPSASGVVEPWELIFEEPIEVGAVRFVSATGGRGSVLEFEVVTVQCPYHAENITVAYGAEPDLNPTIQWTIPAELSTATQVRLLRAYNVEDEFMPISDWMPITTTEYTDTETFIGVANYYKVETMLADGSTSVSPASRAIHRPRRLDRSYTDESTLLSGITLIKTMTGGFLDYRKTFDNNIDSFPDSSDNTQPLGLDFGEKVYVGLISYVCRHDNACFARILNVALYYNTDPADYAQTNKVQATGKMTKASMDATRYFVPVENNPIGGAQCWFFWWDGINATGPGTFGGFNHNIADLRFYGWTSADLEAAAIVSAPSSIDATRTAEGKVLVVWGAGSNVTNYEVQRRAQGVSEWTTITTLLGTQYLDEPTQGVYEYRVVALGNNSQRANSVSTKIAFYEAGNGTGLAGTLFWPFVASDTTKCIPANSIALPVGNINLCVKNGDEFVAGTGCKNNARLMWRGKLIVPFDAAYTFFVDHTDGASLWIDGTAVQNSWTTGKDNISSSLTLTAGEHDIELDARLEVQKNSEFHCYLRWSGPFKEEIIPASQLIPAATQPSFDLNGWTCSYFNQRRLGRVVPIDGGFHIYSCLNLGTSRNALNATFLWKPWSGPVDISVDTARLKNGLAGVAVRNEAGNMLFVYNYGHDGWGDYGVYSVLNGSDDVKSILDPTRYGENSNFNSCVRLVYSNGLFTFYWRNRNTQEWTEIAHFQNDGSFDPSTMQVGLMLMGNTDYVGGEFNFTNIVLKEGPKGMMILIR